MHLVFTADGADWTKYGVYYPKWRYFPSSAVANSTSPSRQLGWGEELTSAIGTFVREIQHKMYAASVETTEIILLGLSKKVKL